MLTWHGVPCKVCVHAARVDSDDLDVAALGAVVLVQPLLTDARHTRLHMAQKTCRITQDSAASNQQRQLLSGIMCQASLRTPMHGGGHVKQVIAWPQPTGLSSGGTGTCWHANPVTDLGDSVGQASLDADKGGSGCDEDHTCIACSAANKQQWWGKRGNKAAQH